MSTLNEAPMASRIQIAFFGSTNAGKSSLINAVTAQEVSVVSEKEGTTTDPVVKTMELNGLGPAALTDTPGLDDNTQIGELRMKRTKEIFDRTDIAVVVVDALNFSDSAIALIDKCKYKGKPYIVVINKSDLISENIKAEEKLSLQDTKVISVSALKGTGINLLKEEIIKLGLKLKKENKKRPVADLIKKGDTVILVIPIDKSAPEGRIILPQQQVIRDILDCGANALCIKDSELEDFFKGSVLSGAGLKPALVITDSQVFKYVSDIVPEDIPLTSFSILMARLKGTLKTQVEGAAVLDDLSDGDYVLISEGCTHHRQCEDIGTVKLPAMIKKHTGKELMLEFSSGHSYPEDLSKFRLVIHCGGCMLGESEMKSRVERASESRVPVTNYGVAIAHMSGILKRSLEPLGDI